MLELGDDFAFIGRQRRLRIGNEWYRVDLLFFHGRLKSLIILDLKLGKFTHADAGQMHLYLTTRYQTHCQRTHQSKEVIRKEEVILDQTAMDKEIHKLDQSPHAYTVIHGVISESDKILIEDIKLRYSYKGDLFYHLITLPSWVNSYTDTKRQHGRLKTQKTLYRKTMKAAEKLQEYMGYFSGDMRGQMRDMLRKENRFVAFSAIEDNLPFIINQCRYKALSTPKDKGGQPSGSLSNDLIWLFIQQYEYNMRIGLN